MHESESAEPRHVPVLAGAAVDALVWRPDGVYVDATLGEGGHAERICEKLAGGGKLVGIDRDPTAHEIARRRLAPWADRVIARVSPFGRLAEVLDEIGIGQIAGALFDLGVSSSQLDIAERGFSYRFEAPLDMRMGPDAPVTAAEIANEWSETEIARILREYGEEPQARRIARDLVRERARRPVETTGDLARIVGGRGPGRPEKTLSRVFQAFRIAVNGELDEIDRALRAALDRLETGGRIVVIAYHSLEDRMVKQWMRAEAAGCICPPGFPVCRCGHVPRLRLVTKHVVTPEPEEIAANPRARSAKMRVAERIVVEG